MRLKTEYFGKVFRYEIWRNMLVYRARLTTECAFQPKNYGKPRIWRTAPKPIGFLYNIKFDKFSLPIILKFYSLDFVVS